MTKPTSREIAERLSQSFYTNHRASEIAQTVSAIESLVELARAVEAYDTGNGYISDAFKVLSRVKELVQGI